MEIRVDTREHGLTEFFTNNTAPESPWSVRSVPLELGDIQIVDEGKGIRYVFERKTFQDLAASIKDGRYREQKSRLLASFSPSHITYLLEDVNTRTILCPKSTHQCFFGLSKSAFESFLLHTRYRDGIHIHCSATPEETARYVMALAHRLHLHPEMFSGSKGANTAYIDTCAIKSCKRSNITPMVCFQLQLGQIPGLSSGIAKIVSQHISSMRDLTRALSKYPTPVERMKWLQTIPSLGKKKAEAICTYLGFTDDEQESESASASECPSAL
jgi:ERCC4-type nuclease